MNKRKPILSFLLSLFVSGLGQVYNGNLKKGIIFSVLIFPFYLLIAVSCKTDDIFLDNYETDNLKIERISESVFLHVSFLEFPNNVRIACNGLIFIDNNEAIVFDTPVDDSTSAELIGWIMQNQKMTITSVVINHFHNDCLGGLNEFHKYGIESYASHKTIELAKNNDENIPKNGFEEKLELRVGDQTTITEYFGPGHTIDNVVSYIPSEKILFGGCLIKSLGATKGNLADADVEHWSRTVNSLKERMPDSIIVVPGHGEIGHTELLDYTIKLFQKE